VPLGARRRGAKPPVFDPDRARPLARNQQPAAAKPEERRDSTPSPSPGCWSWAATIVLPALTGAARALDHLYPALSLRLTGLVGLFAGADLPHLRRDLGRVMFRRAREVAGGAGRASRTRPRSSPRRSRSTAGERGGAGLRNL